MSQRPGILPSQSIEALIASGSVTSASPFDVDQVQPASLDLRLGATAWRVRASFLPGRGRRVIERMGEVAMHRLDLSAGAVLERGCVYIVEVQERLKLPAGVAGRANPKSSTGRVDVFVRLLTDGGCRVGEQHLAIQRRERLRGCNIELRNDRKCSRLPVQATQGGA